MAIKSTVHAVSREIKEVEREISLIRDLTVDNVSGTFCPSKEVKISSGDLLKMELRLYDLLAVLKDTTVELPFQCRNGN